MGIMADAEKSKLIQVTYLGDSPRPNGVIGGAVPVKGNTYSIRASQWKAKKGSKDWKEEEALTDKPAKKKTAKKKPAKKTK